jgi:hypothetical protein
MAAMVKKLSLLVLAVAVFLPQPASAADLRTVDAYRYDWAHGCTGHSQPGTLALADWLAANSLGGSWGIYNCRKIGTGTTVSLHAEGRAIDWHLDARKPVEFAAAKRLIKELLGSDASGHPRALARRMGVQEIIYNCRMWSANDGAAGMRPYPVCKRRVSATVAHRDHLHIGLNWRGAREQSTFWRIAAPSLLPDQAGPGLTTASP